MQKSASVPPRTAVLQICAVAELRGTREAPEPVFPGPPASPAGGADHPQDVCPAGSAFVAVPAGQPPSSFFNEVEKNEHFFLLRSFFCADLSFLCNFFRAQTIEGTRATEIAWPPN